VSGAVGPGASRPLAEQRFLLHGLGVTNRAVATALVSRGASVVLSDDSDPAAASRLAEELGAAARPAPDLAAARSLLGEVDALVPTPGLPSAHQLLGLAAELDVPVLSEFDLAAAWDDRPVVAVTGTNGKTTVTSLIVSMFEQDGRRAAAVGNTETPLVAAIDDPTTEVFVVEASSFRLLRSRSFHPRVGVWLNWAPDHLDVHSSAEEYRDAKARIWRDMDRHDIAVANADDPVVAAVAARLAGPQLRWFSTSDPTVEFHDDGSSLVTPDGDLIAHDRLWSALPHDRANALAAAAAADAMGVHRAAIVAALESFRGLPHRVELVGAADGVSWFDDSKSTAPHSTRSALRGFDSVVLIAGGRNKGLDLGELALGADVVHAVVGIGEAGAEIVAAFPDREAVLAGDMTEAVRIAHDLARRGDAVVLSPACASFDQYSSYAERGRDFAAIVRREVLTRDHSTEAAE